LGGPEKAPTFLVPIINPPLSARICLVIKKLGQMSVSSKIWFPIKRGLTDQAGNGSVSHKTQRLKKSYFFFFFISFAYRYSAAFLASKSILDIKE
jgi:hypothetical protein